MCKGKKLDWNDSGGAISFWCSGMREEIAFFLELKGLEEMSVERQKKKILGEVSCLYAYGKARRTE